mmetsp:Transcript_15582/g.37182  ORF Transcript_15582/g.37182 Transcript_15582/m.37182 type:complete len:253 (+) Transcript_15582:186-944(+)
MLWGMVLEESLQGRLVMVGGDSFEGRDVKRGTSPKASCRTSITEHGACSNKLFLLIVCESDAPCNSWLRLQCFAKATVLPERLASELHRIRLVREVSLNGHGKYRPPTMRSMAPKKLILHSVESLSSIILHEAWVHPIAVDDTDEVCRVHSKVGIRRDVARDKHSVRTVRKLHAPAPHLNNICPPRILECFVVHGERFPCGEILCPHVVAERARCDHLAEQATVVNQPCLHLSRLVPSKLELDPTAALGLLL